MWVVNTDAKSCLSETPEKWLQEAASAKKKMYLEAWLQQCHHFSPSIASIDGLLYVDAADTLKRIAIHLAKKWHQPYSRMYGCFNSSIDITLVRATHWCI